MKKEEIIEELGQVTNVHLEDVFYSDFLQSDDVHAIYELDVDKPEVLYNEMVKTGVTKEQLEKAIDRGFETESLAEFVEDWLNDNIDFSKTASDYGFYGRQADYDFF